MGGYGGNLRFPLLVNRPAERCEGNLGCPLLVRTPLAGAILATRQNHSGLIPALFTTVAHFTRSPRM
jgi:pyruvate/2-oxoglutarate/acetoin dehydrogenase E1 component